MDNHLLITTLISSNLTAEQPTPPRNPPAAEAPPPQATELAPLHPYGPPVSLELPAINPPQTSGMRLAQRMTLATDGSDVPIQDSVCPDATINAAPDAGAPFTFNAVAVITSAEAASLSLTNAQRTAIMKLTSGCTRVDAAAAAGVTRLTLYRWLKHDPAFQCAYNAWQKDLIMTAQGQLLAATHDAMATVINAIRKGDARLAWKLLESQGITGAPKSGPTDIHELQRHEELEKKKREIAERKERHNIAIDDIFTLDEI